MISTNGLFFTFWRKSLRHFFCDVSNFSNFSNVVSNWIDRPMVILAIKKEKSRQETAPSEFEVFTILRAIRFGRFVKDQKNQQLLDEIFPLSKFVFNFFSLDGVVFQLFLKSTTLSTERRSTTLTKGRFRPP